MSSFSRRDFFKASIAGAGLLAAAPRPAHAAEAVVHFSGTDLVELGKTGVKVSRLAHGTGFRGGNHSSELTRAGKASFDALFGHSIDQGVSFIDMADSYGSHTFVKDVIAGKPRDKFALLTKIETMNTSWARWSGGAKAEVERFCKDLGTDYLDVVLIHCMRDAKWATQYERVRDELSELKKKGTVRAIGVSCHDIGALKVAAEHAWGDIVLARVNHKCGKQYSCDAGLEEVTAALKTARTNGKGIIGMKIFGEGKLAKPEDQDASLKFVFTNDLVDAITIGMLKPGEVDDTLRRMSQVTKG
jgi:predicted aldo/keto reductase-like oxidoreductase